MVFNQNWKIEMELCSAKRMLLRTTRQIKCLEEKKVMLEDLIKERTQQQQMADQQYKLWKKSKKLLKENK